MKMGAQYRSNKNNARAIYTGVVFITTVLDSRLRGNDGN